jgi:hypothetical protein
VISAEVSEALEVVRTHIRSLRERNDPVGFMYRVCDPLPDVTPGIPGAYAELLRISDGGKIGAFQYQDHKEPERRGNQLDLFPDVMGNRALDLFYEFGVFVDAPVALCREDGSVWSFANLSRVWWMDQEIEQVAVNIDEYLRERIFNRDVAVEFGEGEWAEILDATGAGLPSRDL